MGTNYNPKVVTDSLVYYVDGANPKSVVDATNINDISLSLNHSTYLNNSGALSYNATDKTYDRTILNNSDIFRSNSKIDLTGNGFTMNLLVKVITLGAQTSANGLLTNHSHIDNSGGGITVKGITVDDFRISCNTGNSTSRTYHSYYGTSNIKGVWAYLTMRYNETTNKVSLLVNGEQEFEVVYSQYCIADYIDLFCWSTTHYTSGSYRPTCQISNASVYNKDLTDDEIQQNFEALRGRFGI